MSPPIAVQSRVKGKPASPEKPRRPQCFRARSFSPLNSAGRENTTAPPSATNAAPGRWPNAPPANQPPMRLPTASQSRIEGKPASPEKPRRPQLFRAHSFSLFNGDAVDVPPPKQIRNAPRDGQPAHPLTAPAASPQATKQHLRFGQGSSPLSPFTLSAGKCQQPLNTLHFECW